MSDPFVGEVKIVGFGFPPRGWAFCDGRILPISQHAALFSLLGTTFGGDGRTTFGLPDTRGRSILGVGNGPGVPTIRWGGKGGQSSPIITEAQLPSHTHSLMAENDPASKNNPKNRMLANTAFSDRPIYANSDGENLRTMGSASIGNTGKGQQLNIRNPYIGMFTIIALAGIYPPRS